MKIITITLVIFALMSATVFAAVGKPPTEEGFSFCLHQGKNLE